jgi:hypothetical protein
LKLNNKKGDNMEEKEYCPDCEVELVGEKYVDGTDS